MQYNINSLNAQERAVSVLDLLDQCPMVESEFTKPNPYAVPLIEAIDYGESYMVRYKDLVSLSDEYDITIQEATEWLAEVNVLNNNDIIVAVEEWRPYVDPLILHRFTNEYVVIPEYNTPSYRLCEYCMNNYLESGDDFWVDLYIQYPEILPIVEAVIGIEGKPGYLENILKTITQEKNEVSYQISNSSLSANQKRALTDKLSRIDRQAMEVEEKIRERDTNRSAVQAKRAAYVTNSSNTYNDKNAGIAGNTEMEMRQGMTQDQKKLLMQKNKQIRDLKKNNSFSGMANNVVDTVKDAINGAKDSASNAADQSKSWLAQKWSAFTNWFNNAGQANSDGHVGWFSNLVGKIKNGLGIQTPTASDTSKPAVATQQTAQSSPASTAVANKPEEQQKPETASTTKAKPITTDVSSQVSKVFNDNNKSNSEKQAEYNNIKQGLNPTPAQPAPKETKEQKQERTSTAGPKGKLP